MKIFSPMAYGNGAYILHKTLEKHLKGYGVREYSPYLTLFPILLKTISIPHDIDLIHTTPDYAPFFFKKKQAAIDYISRVFSGKRLQGIQFNIAKHTLRNSPQAIYKFGRPKINTHHSRK